MAFGCGVLIATLTFPILVEAFEVTHTLPATATGFFLGGISFSIANYILEKKSKRLGSRNKQLVASEDKNTAAVSKPNSGKTLFIGSIMDNIPENAALGITLAAGGAINIAFLVAIFVSNLPEALGSTTQMKASGMSRRYILKLWALATVIGTISSVIGYTVLANAPPPVISIYSVCSWSHPCHVGTFMIPEAFKHGGFWKGIALLAGFQIAVILTSLQE